MSKKNKKLTIFLVCLLLVVWAAYIFINMNRIPDSATVNNGKHRTSWASIILDSEDAPHVTWYKFNWSDEINTNDNYYVKHDGTNWLTVDGVIFDNINGVVCSSDMISTKSSVSLDEKNNPHFLWFVREKIDSPNGYFQNDYLRYAKWNGENLVTEKNKSYNPRAEYVMLSTNDVDDIQIQVDSNGFPHIAWEDADRSDGYDPDVMYVRWNGENWVTVTGEIFDNETRNANVSNTKRIMPADVQLVLDSNDYPCLAWVNSSIYDDTLIFVRWNSKNWVTAKNEIYNPRIKQTYIHKSREGIEDALLQLDSDDNPHLSWQKYNERTLRNGREIAYIRWDGENWRKIDNSLYTPESEDAPTGLPIKLYREVSFEIDSNSLPHFVWSNHYKDIYYSKWDGEEWLTASGENLTEEAKNCNISKNIYESDSPEFVLDSKDNPHIVWCSAGFISQNEKVVYIKWNGTNWVCADGSKY